LGLQNFRIFISEEQLHEYDSKDIVGWLTQVMQMPFFPAMSMFVLRGFKGLTIHDVSRTFFARLCNWDLFLLILTCG